MLQLRGRIVPWWMLAIEMEMMRVAIKKMLITKTKYEFSLFNMYVLQFLDDYTINADAVLLMYVQKLVSQRFSYLVPLCPNKLPLFHLHTNSLAPW